jgi:hypothetical protein
MALSPAAASASWGPSHCSASVHCYATASREITRFGGVLASVDFVDTTGVEIYSYCRATNEQWISFPGAGRNPNTEWIETGQSLGCPYYDNAAHPFYAEKLHGLYKEHLAEGTFPLNSYNHFVLYDLNVNGLWRIYWQCCEVGSYGGGWPAYLTEQEAGIEVATETRPHTWGRQEVAASDGGAWTAWNGIEYERFPGICMQQNVETPTAEGNIMWGTLGGPPNEECA